MKKTLSVFFVFFCLIFSKGFSQKSDIDIISYNIKASYDFNTRIIYFTADVNLENTDNSSSIKLLLTSYSTLKSIKIGNYELKTSRISDEDDTLFITIPEALKNNKLLKISFDYSIPIDTFILANVIPLRREHRWYPLQYNDIASMKLDVIVPNSYLVLTTGDLKNTEIMNDNSECFYEMNNCGSFALIVAPKDIMQTTVKKVDSVNIKFYFAIQKDSVLNKYMIKVEADMMADICNSFSFYNKYIEPYKHKELNVFEIPEMSGGLGQSLYTLIVFTTPLKFDYQTGFGWPIHEVAHQWWGDEMHIKANVKGRWFLEESITEYFKDIYIQNAMGDDSLKKLIKTYQTPYNVIDTSMVLSILETTNVSTGENAYVIYQKGPLIVNKLRNLMGNDNYQKFIREVYSTYSGQFLTYDDFIKVLRKNDTTGNWVSSLDKWVNERGIKE